MLNKLRTFVWSALKVIRKNLLNANSCRGKTLCRPRHLWTSSPLCLATREAPLCCACNTFGAPLLFLPGECQHSALVWSSWNRAKVWVSCYGLLVVWSSRVPYRTVCLYRTHCDDMQNGPGWCCGENLVQKMQTMNRGENLKARGVFRIMWHPGDFWKLWNEGEPTWLGLQLIFSAEALVMWAMPHLIVSENDSEQL